jgi:hypothetical protein
VELFPITENNKIETYVFKLPKFYFIFFSHVIYSIYPEQEGIVITFKKVFKNFSRFIYYTESERLIDSIAEYFGYDDKLELETRKKEFVYENKNTTFEWNFDGGMIRIEKDEDTNRPILIYVISTRKEE